MRWESWGREVSKDVTERIRALGEARALEWVTLEAVRKIEGMQPVVEPPSSPSRR
jgi:hypothetical protein